MQSGKPDRPRVEYDGSVSIMLDDGYCMMMAMSYRNNLKQNSESLLIEATSRNGFSEVVSNLSIQYVTNKFVLAAGGELIIEFKCKPSEITKRSNEVLGMLKELKIITQPHIAMIPSRK